jgi:sialic acid synthase
LIFFATAFDFKSADFLMELGVPAIKVASGDLKSAPLISYLSQFNIPLILSTGGSSLQEIRRAMEDVNPENVAISQCTAAYPAEAEDMNLKVISQFRNEFPSTTIGLSSHDRGISFPVTAFALGARVIEKHFTLDRSMKGTDHSYSLEPTGMKKMVRDLKLTKIALGTGVKSVLDKEIAPIRKMGKMLVYSKDLSPGTILKLEDFDLKSPQIGLNPQAIDHLIGKKLLTKVQRNQVVELEDVEL